MKACTNTWSSCTPLPAIAPLTIALPHHPRQKELSKVSTHQSALLASGVQVNLDQLLEVVMASWTEERLEQAETLKSVFQTVDIDNNGMLDIDEFVEVRSRHTAHARCVCEVVMPLCRHSHVCIRQ